MFDVDKFKLNTVKEKDNYGNYTLGPLPTGYGLTIGNVFRRILLSSVEGAALTSVKVVGVKHEYSTIPGVVDDVLTIILRLKRIAFKCHSDEPQTIELDIKGKKVVKAKDIKLTSDVEIANPDLFIAEISDTKGKLRIEMTVEKGAGYSHSDEKERNQVGLIPLDADFSPVKKVTYNVNKTRVGRDTELDEIDIEIYTNNVVTPKEAIEQASAIFYKTALRLTSAIKGIDEEEVEVKTEDVQEDSQSSDLDIDKLNLSARLTHSLIKAGYANLTELEGMSMDQIVEIRGLGKKSAEELVDIMKSYKLEVKE